MPYSEDTDKIKDIPTSSTIPKTIREKKQKDFTSEQVAGMSSELTKANRKLRSGIFTTQQYAEERQRIFLKYDIKREERIRYLGKKFAS